MSETPKDRVLTPADIQNRIFRHEPGAPRVRRINFNADPKAVKASLERGPQLVASVASGMGNSERTDSLSGLPQLTELTLPRVLAGRRLRSRIRTERGIAAVAAAVGLLALSLGARNELQNMAASASAQTKLAVNGAIDYLTMPKRLMDKNFADRIEEQKRKNHR